jgi:hypothetical protein
LGLPIENSIHVCVLSSQLYSPRTYRQECFPAKRVFATKGSNLEKTSFGDGDSLLSSLDAAVHTDVIVLE